ncbi:MAG: flagellar motor switch protein FliN [Desulfurivibrio sp.]|nr:flagellar motor switch protein FliN [Desulfurivibrio sp.]MBU3937710.1 flagellar motor switch protein FliN [Pseudomonadota bacterium]MBU4034088.1 flagellar motor switch protein FliN [Pseudomonadota bacterium]MBU4118977.1 flagellar motor switch protein FliN [Pseudomonadota bacterium]
MADDPLDDAGTKTETEGAGDDWAAALSEHEGSGGAQAPAFAELGGSVSGATPAGSQNLDFLLDIPLNVTVELGRTSMIINKMLQLTQGSVVELDKAAGEPVEIFVNDKLLGKGEVIVVNERFGVRITEIISQADRIKNIG